MRWRRLCPGAVSATTCCRAASASAGGGARRASSRSSGSSSTTSCRHLGPRRFCEWHGSEATWQRRRRSAILRSPRMLGFRCSSTSFPRRHRIQPDLVLVSAGFDAHRADLLGGCLLDSGRSLRWHDTCARSAGKSPRPSAPCSRAASATPRSRSSATVRSNYAAASVARADVARPRSLLAPPTRIATRHGARRLGAPQSSEGPAC